MIKRRKDIEAAECLFDALTNIFSTSSHIKEILILLGSTIMSPKEVFVLRFPTSFYDGPILPYKQCLTSVFHKLVSEDLLGDVAELNSIVKMSVMILAPRDQDYSCYNLKPQLNYKIPQRGRKFKLNFECHRNVNKLGAELSIMDETLFDMSGIEPLNKTMDPDHDPCPVPYLKTEQCRTSSHSVADDEPVVSAIPMVEILDTSDLSEPHEQSFKDMSYTGDQLSFLGDSHDFVWYLLPQTFKGYKETLPRNQSVM